MQSDFARRGLATALGLTVALAPLSLRAEELTGTLKKVKDAGAITIGYRDASVPFSYLGGDQKPVGYAMDICYKIADAVKAKLKLPNLEVKLNPVTSATRIPLMANGTIDLECGSTTNNAEREKQVWFTNSHFLTATRYVSKKSANLHTIEDLKGKTVVSTSGTTNIKQINEANTERKLGLTILPAKDHAEAFLMVETGRAAAFVMDDVLLASPRRVLEGPLGLRDLHRGAVEARALRHHAAQGRHGLQEGRGRRHRQALHQPRGQGALRQVVHQADPAAQHQPQPADERGDEEAVHHADRQPRSGGLLRSIHDQAHRGRWPAARRDRRRTRRPVLAFTAPPSSPSS